MRHALAALGPDGLLDSDLLALALDAACPTRDTTRVVQELVSHFGSFAAVVAAPPGELARISGMSEAAVTRLKLIQAAALRLARSELRGKPLLTSWDQLMDYLTACLARERVEHLRVLFLDTKNRLIADETLARGTVNHAPVYPREVLRRAIDLHASALILVHNHPSGDPTPSEADIGTTQAIAAAGQLLSIVLHDHVIIGNGRWVSLRREGLL